MDKDTADLTGFLERANALEAPEECQAFKQEYCAMPQEELRVEGPGLYLSGMRVTAPVALSTAYQP